MKSQFPKQQGRIKREALIKSLLYGTMVGFAVTFVSAAALWALGSSLWWLSLIALLLVTLVSALIFYAKKFKVTPLSSARRLDRLGLDERAVTMVQFDGVSSEILSVQKKDAEEKIRLLDPKLIKLTLKRSLVITLTVVFLLGSGMTVFGALSAYGVLPNVDEFIEIVTPPEREVRFEVSYIVETGGYIEGPADQLVLSGQDAEPVVAVADEGYQFICWDDGRKKPSRQDFGITQNLYYTAIFVPIDDEDGGGFPSEGDDGTPSDMPIKGSSSTDTPTTGDPNANGLTGGGKYEEANQIIDGSIYYREVLAGYRDELLKYLEEYGDTLTPEERKIIEAYIKIV